MGSGQIWPTEEGAEGIERGLQGKNQPWEWGNALTSFSFRMRCQAVSHCIRSPREQAQAAGNKRSDEPWECAAAGTEVRHPYPKRMHPEPRFRSRKRPQNPIQKPRAPETRSRRPNNARDSICELPAQRADLASQLPTSHPILVQASLWAS
jgi:hypothetical protein